MSTAAGEVSTRARPARRRIARLLRSAALKALIGANIVAAIVILLRGWGLLQPLELEIYDALRVAWAGHQPSPRIVLVGGTEADVEHWDWPLRDGDLATLLERIAGWQPRVIGVDLYRDHPEPPGSDRLAAVLARHKEILWAFKLKDGNRPGIPPPAMLRGSDRAVLADVVADQGNIVRRGLLYADDGVDNYPGMGMALALGYLAADHIRPAPMPGEQLRLGKAVLAPLDDARGPYVKLDSRGYQVLLDYRGGSDPFALKSVGDIMHGADAAALVRGRAVIVGITSESVKDYFATPFNTGFHNADPIYGIALHALVADQLIRRARWRSGLSGLSRGIENLWIWGWAMAGRLSACSSATAPGGAGLGRRPLVLAGPPMAVRGGPAAAGVACCDRLGRLGRANKPDLYAASNRARALLAQDLRTFFTACRGR